MNASVTILSWLRKCCSTAAIVLPISCSAAAASDITPTQRSFFEAAVLFITGKEHLSILVGADRNGKQLPGTLVTDVYLPSEGGETSFRWGYDNPCQIIEVQNLNQTGFDFNKFPGPNSVKMSSSGYELALTLPEGAIITAKRRVIGGCNNAMPRCDTELVPGSTMIDGDGTIYDLADTSGVAKRLFALNYIRRNFCPGLPDAPAGNVTDSASPDFDTSRQIGTWELDSLIHTKNEPDTECIAPKRYGEYAPFHICCVLGSGRYVLGYYSLPDSYRKSPIGQDIKLSVTIDGVTRTLISKHSSEYNAEVDLSISDLNAFASLNRTAQVSVLGQWTPTWTIEGTPEALEALGTYCVR